MTDTRDRLKRLADDAIGKTETFEDEATLSPVARLQATLDRDDPSPRPGDALPPGWHWLYFLPDVPQARIGHDGHAMRGDFLPAVPMPRRMWASGEMIFHRPILLGQALTRTSEIADVQIKEGRTGTLVFVTVRHTISGPDGPATTEIQNLVFREAPKPDDVPTPPLPVPADAEWSRTIEPDPVLLFRYSALTFNGHRIHYDHPYVTGVEGYPGLIVHGPLLATLLLDLVRRHRPEATLEKFSFRALRPVFDTGPFRIGGKPDGRDVMLWAEDNDGHLAMRASVTLKERASAAPAG